MAKSEFEPRNIVAVPTQTPKVSLIPPCPGLKVPSYCVPIQLWAFYGCTYHDFCMLNIKFFKGKEYVLFTVAAPNMYLELIKHCYKSSSRQRVKLISYQVMAPIINLFSLPMGVGIHSNFKIAKCVEIGLWFKGNDTAEK